MEVGTTERESASRRLSLSLSLGGARAVRCALRQEVRTCGARSLEPRRRRRDADAISGGGDGDSRRGAGSEEEEEEEITRRYYRSRSVS